MGSSANETLVSGTANDTIKSSNGDESIQSGRGDDNIDAGRGNDTISDSGGGSDYDAIVFSTPIGTDGVAIAFISGTTPTYDYQTTLANTFGNFTGFEQISLNGGNDTVSLGVIGSQAYGQAGNDQLAGGSGSDRFVW